MLTTAKLKVLSQLKKYLPVVKIMRIIASFFREISAKIHKFQYKIEWSIDNPEHFDHFIDMNFQWKRTRHAFPMERGVFSSYALPGIHGSIKGNTLDLCCGDGFYSYYFYSLHSAKVVGIDFDPLAIWSAKKFNSAENTEYVIGDIRNNIPDGPFDNIVWDAAMEHFTPSEIDGIMQNICRKLTPNGILSGYTIKEPESGKHLHQHEYEFHNKEDLASFLKPYFSKVQILETQYKQRTNYYFFASNSELPFDANQIFHK